MLGSLTQTTTDQARRNAIYAVAGITNPAGGSGGASVTVTISQNLTDAFGNGLLPAAYACAVSPSQACLVSIGSKTSSSFNVILTPSPATATLAAGTFDALVLA